APHSSHVYDVAHVSAQATPSRSHAALGGRRRHVLIARRRPGLATEIEHARLGFRVHRMARSRGVQPLGRDFHSTPGTRSCEFIVYGASEFIGDDIVDHGRAVTRVIRYGYRWATHLLPFEHQVAPHITIGTPAPAHQNPTVVVGKRTILCGISNELMQNH